MPVEQHVVPHHVAGGPGVDVDAPAAVGGVHDRGVHDHVGGRAGRGVDAVQTDPARVIVVEEVVLDQAVGDAVHVDPGAATCPVTVDHVRLDQGARDDAVAPLAGVAVHVDAVGVVVVHVVAPDDG